MRHLIAAQVDNEMMPILLGSLIFCLANIALILASPAFAFAVEMSAQ
jgi:hypothetical protein